MILIYGDTSYIYIPKVSYIEPTNMSFTNTSKAINENNVEVIINLSNRAHISYLYSYLDYIKMSVPNFMKSEAQSYGEYEYELYNSSYVPAAYLGTGILRKCTEDNAYIYHRNRQQVKYYE